MITRRGLLLMMTICLALKAAALPASDSPLAIDPVDRYILRWENSGGMESASRHHVHELLTLLGVPTPDSPRPDVRENVYTYEMTHRVQKPDGSTSTGMSDLCYEGHVLIEMKQGYNPGGRRDGDGPVRRGHGARGTHRWDTMMVDARTQAFRYALSMPESSRPPFVIVWDLGYAMEIYSDFTFSGQYTAYPAPGKHRLRLHDLRDDQVRDMLRRIWLDPYSLDPMRETHRVTHDVARLMGGLAASLGADPDEATEFVARCIFTMLAEDMRLVPNNTFLRILEDCQADPEAFVPTVTSLWRDMYAGGRGESSGRRLRRFGDDDFFRNARALPLDREQIAVLRQAAECQWYHVDPVVMSSLVEATLSDDKRLGAFYTHPAYADKVVVPTVIEPLRARWAEAVETVQGLVAAGDFQAAREAVREFHRSLTEVKVLDPNCGSANFLAATLAQLKTLEAEVFSALQDLGESRRGTQQIPHAVGPSQMYGIEINPRAAHMARLVLLMTDLKMQYQLHGRVRGREPIIRDLPNIDCRDALLAWDSIEPLVDTDGEPVMRWDGKTYRTDSASGLPVPDETALVQDVRYINARPADPYPEVDFIVGNPAFLGSRAMKKELGEGYNTALRNAYPFLPDGADLVMYVWARCAMMLRDGQIQAMGMITTDSIGRGANRKVVQSFLEGEPPLWITMACPDMPWWSDGPSGAKVRVAMMVLRRGRGEGTLYTVVGEKAGYGVMEVEQTAEQGVIYANLSLTPPPDDLHVLRSNLAVGATGISFGHKDFVITGQQARELGLGSREGLERHIRPLLSGRDLSFAPRGMYGIDFHGMTAEEAEARFPEAFEWLRSRVYPARKLSADQSVREKWWLPGSPQLLSRVMQEGMDTKIVTPATTVRRYFVVVPTDTICVGGGVFEIFLDDPFYLGVLSSGVHLNWALAVGERHRSGYRYLSRCFTMFPFPDCGRAEKDAVRQAMNRIETHREECITGANGRTMAVAQRLLAALRAGEALDEADAETAARLRIAELAALHSALDEAVLKAYGWKKAMRPPDQLEALYRLNTERAAEERAGKVRWLRPDRQQHAGAAFRFN